jgi:hypothetical protein
MRRRAKDFAPDPTMMLSVYVPNPDGRNTRCIGFILPRGTRGFEAFADDRSLGLFQSQRAAADALADALSETVS